MGYYDGHSEHTRRSKKSRGWLLPALIGLFIGVFLVILALPALMQSNLLPYNLAEQGSPQGENEGNSTGNLNQSINAEITTEVTEIVEEVTPAVVGVVNLQQNQANLFGEVPESESGSNEEAGTGSGVIYKEENGRAFVVTNHHVIEGAAEVEVVLSNDSQIPAEVVGSDLFSDLAVLEISAEEVEHVMEIGSSEAVKVGEPAIAIGNPLGLRFSGSVTKGIISGTQRTVPQDFNMDGRPDWQAEVMQTDAAINPGNSGGALVNIAGQLIGINSMKIAQSQVEGIGFAIPIDTAVPIMEELEETGRVTRPYLGVVAYSLEEIPQSEWQNTFNLPESVEGGIFIENIEAQSPADQAGLEQMDVITAIDGQPVRNLLDLRQHLYDEKEIGEEMEVTFYRNGEEHQVTAELASQNYGS